VREEVAPVAYRLRGGPWGLAALGTLVLVPLIIGLFADSVLFVAVAVTVAVAAWFYMLVLVSYEADLTSGGDLEFRGVFRRQHTNVDAVESISVTRGESRAMAFKIVFDGGTTRIGHRAGRAFVREILARNPSIETRGLARDF
jgi:hypothetical protein